MISISQSTAGSRLYTLIDSAREYALYFLEGQRLIEDLALVHPIRGEGFAYFRDVVLSVQPIIALLNGGDQLGFYIDSERPEFRLKIETGHAGVTRCMLLPEEFQEFAEVVHGLVRTLKYSPSRAPYESVLRVHGEPLRNIVNQVLSESYQVNCAMLLSQVSDQSVLLHQLPPLRNEEIEYSPGSVRARREGIREGVQKIFALGLSDADRIASAFAEIGFRTLAHRPIQFRCDCSRERMISNLGPVYAQEGDALFGEDETLELTCEYCKSRYKIGKSDLQGRSGN